MIKSVHYDHARDCAVVIVSRGELEERMSFCTRTTQEFVRNEIGPCPPRLSATEMEQVIRTLSQPYSGEHTWKSPREVWEEVASRVTSDLVSEYLQMEVPREVGRAVLKGENWVPDSGPEYDYYRDDWR